MCGIEPVVRKSGRRNPRNVKKTYYSSQHFEAYSGILHGLNGLLNRNGFFGFPTCLAYYPTPDIKVCITIND